MKKKEIKMLRLNKNSVTNLEALKNKGGHAPDHTCLCPSHSICPPGIYCF